jgi:hypothetical protein
MENRRTIVRVTIDNGEVEADGTPIKIGEKYKMKSLLIQLENTGKSEQQLVVSPGEGIPEYEFILGGNTEYDIDCNSWMKIAEESITINHPIFEGI